MNKHNTILGQIVALISSARFEKPVKEHKTKRGFIKNIKKILIILIFYFFCVIYKG